MSKATPSNEARDTIWKYQAFISYRQSPNDRKAAVWLQRSMERYRIPRALRLKRALPRKLGRVFRDEAELAASANLSETISRALRSCQSLVVVCSPRTPDSRWVSEEIIRFRELNPKNPVLSLLIEGQPHESFPRQLTEISASKSLPWPDSQDALAADIRPVAGEWNSTRRHLAKLRLLAAILECDFDELRRRDGEARRRFATTLGLLGSLLL